MESSWSRAEKEAKLIAEAERGARRGYPESCRHFSIRFLLEDATVLFGYKMFAFVVVKDLQLCSRHGNFLLKEVGLSFFNDEAKYPAFHFDGLDTKIMGPRLEFKIEVVPWPIDAHPFGIDT